MAYDVEKEAAKVINKHLMIDAALENPAIIEEIRQEMVFNAVGATDEVKQRTVSSRKTKRQQRTGRNIYSFR